jgi:DNA-binding GntR family transcriptional regulator
MSIATLKQVRRSSLAEEVTAQLRQAIVSGELSPGAPLTEPVLAAQLGVSRGPVREALIALERDGLVQFDGRGRTEVRQLNERDFEEILSLRAALEALAARLASRAWNASLARALQANLQQQQAAKTLGQLSRLDVDLHEMIVRASQNERLIAAWLLLRPQLEMWLTHTFELQVKLHHEPRALTVNSHQLLIEALASGDEERAARVAANHIDLWRKWHPQRLTSTR